jgi:hypothetical protein
MKVTKCSLLAIFAIAVCAMPVGASVMYTGPVLSYNFDGMPTSDATPPDTITPAPFSSTAGVQGVATGSGGWEATKLSGTGTTAMPFIADNGGGNSGAIYSYGAAQASDRALGSVASGSNVPAFGIEVVNNTSYTMTWVEIDFTQENWRSSTSTTNVTQASYSTSAAGTTSANYLSALTGFTDVDSLDLVGPLFGATNGALNGNDPANQAARSAVITGLLIAPGQSFFLRFQDANDVGNDAGLAIDNFELLMVPEPSSLALVVASVGAMLFRRK